jgi:beta-galactosidase
LTSREHININAGWRVSRSTSNLESLSYSTLKQRILPSGNDFSSAKHQRPSRNPPGSSVEYVQSSFDDGAWETVDLPHDWAIKGHFSESGTSIASGRGRLPVNGVGWDGTAGT